MEAWERKMAEKYKGEGARTCGGSYSYYYYNGGGIGVTTREYWKCNRCGTTLYYDPEKKPGRCTFWVDKHGKSE